MKRLTLDKAVSEMSIIELAYNSCYIDKNRNARYRDYSMDIDCRDFVRKIYKDKNIAMPYEFWNDNDTFDEIMLANMEDGLEEVDGFIALFYRNLWAIAELREHLKVYEDMEEQGLLIKLPSKEVYESSGDTVYYIYNYEIVECINCGVSMDCDGKLWIALGCDDYIFPYRELIAGIDTDPTDCCIKGTVVEINEWGKTVFLTKEAAEQTLIKMGYENECKYGKIAIVGGGRNVGKLMKQQIALLEELESYRAIGTLEECKEALEKQIEMELLPPKESTFTYKGICPVCGNRILLAENYCSQCGQKVGVLQK